MQNNIIKNYEKYNVNFNLVKTRDYRTIDLLFITFFVYFWVLSIAFPILSIYLTYLHRTTYYLKNLSFIYVVSKLLFGFIKKNKRVHDTLTKWCIQKKLF